MRQNKIIELFSMTNKFCCGQDKSESEKRGIRKKKKIQKNDHTLDIEKKKESFRFQNFYLKFIQNWMLIHANQITNWKMFREKKNQQKKNMFLDLI